MGMTGQQIYDNFHSGKGGEDLNGAADILNELAATYEERRQGFRDLAVAMEQGWTGNAQDAATRGATPLVVEHDLSGMDLTRGQDLGHRQVGSFGDAKNAVEPVPPRPEQPDLWDNVSTAGIAGQSYEQQVTAYNDAAQRNVDVMNGYTSHSGYNATLPTGSGTLVADQTTVAANDQTGQAGGVIHRRDSGRGTGPGPGGPGGGGSGPSSAAPAPVAPAPVTPSGGPLPSGPPSGSLTTPSGTTPGTAPDLGGNPPPRGPGATPDRSGPGSAPLPAPTGGGAPRPGGPGAARPVTGSPDGTANRSGGGRVGGPQPGPGRGTGTGPLTGGPLAGGRAAEEGAARRGGAGTTGRPGTGMTPMGAAGGRGQGGDDYEHERPSYLVQEDGESNFGIDDKTAPPVIGDEDDD